LVHLTKKSSTKGKGEGSGTVVSFLKNDETIWTIGFNINLTELHFIHSVEIKFWTKNGNKALIVNCLSSIYAVQLPNLLHKTLKLACFKVL